MSSIVYEKSNTEALRMVSSVRWPYRVVCRIITASPTYSKWSFVRQRPMTDCLTDLLHLLGQSARNPSVF
jgi:hypothetical protein